MRKHLQCALVTVAFLLLTGGTTADAATDGPGKLSTSSSFENFTWADVDLYNCATDFCAPRTKLYRGQTLDDYCYVVGRYVGTSPYWDYVYDRASRQWGYVAEYYLASSAQSIPC